MNIVFISLWYPPDPAPIGYMLKELAEGLAEKGDTITVLTTEYDGNLKEEVDANSTVEIIRLPRINICSRYYLLCKSVNYIYYSMLVAFHEFFRKRPDIYFAVFQPLTIVLILLLLARLKQSKLVLNVQDLHPDATVQLGLITNRLLLKVLYKLEKIGYKYSDGITVISENFKNHIIQKVPRKNVEVLENWVDLKQLYPLSETKKFKEKYRISESDFVILYAGNLGYASGAEVLVELIDSMKDIERVVLLIVGEGAIKSDIENLVSQKNLKHVVLILPFLGREELNQMQNSSSISVVTLREGAGKNSVPSKVLAYMAVAKPILVIADDDCETARFVTENDLGFVISRREIPIFSKNFKSVMVDSKELNRLGLNGRRYLERFRSTDVVVDNYYKYFRKIVSDI